MLPYSFKGFQLLGIFLGCCTMSACPTCPIKFSTIDGFPLQISGGQTTWIETSKFCNGWKIETHHIPSRNLSISHVWWFETNFFHDIKSLHHFRVASSFLSPHPEYPRHISCKEKGPWMLFLRATVSGDSNRITFESTRYHPINPTLLGYIQMVQMFFHGFL